MPTYNQMYYIATMQGFAQHWLRADAAIAPDSIKLENGFTQANFSTSIVTLESAFTTVTQQANILKSARGTAKAQRKALILRIEQFRKAVLGAIPSSTYATMLPKTPALAAIDTRFAQAAEAVKTVWNLINTAPPPGFTGPLKLQGGYALADFTTDVTAIKASFATLNQQNLDYHNAIKTRFALFQPARQRMKQYRAAIQARFTPTSTIYMSLPRLSPVAGGTPKAVTDLLYLYDGITNDVTITFTPSTSANISKYQLLFSPGPAWNENDTTVIATNENVAPYKFTFKLTQVNPNVLALFKVVVYNETENRRASRVLKIKRAAQALRVAGPEAEPLARAA